MPGSISHAGRQGKVRSTAYLTCRMCRFAEGRETLRTAFRGYVGMASAGGGRRPQTNRLRV